MTEWINYHGLNRHLFVPPTQGPRPMTEHERIKALEARVAELETVLKDSVTAMRLLLDPVQKHNAKSDTLRSGFPLHLLSIEIGGVRSMLKDPDQ